MSGVDNLRVGRRRIDDEQVERERRIEHARELLEREFIEAVLSDDPATMVSHVKLHRADPELVPVIDALRDVLDDPQGMHMQRLLHMLARRDDSEGIEVLRKIARAFAEDQLNLLLQRGAL